MGHSHFNDAIRHIYHHVLCTGNLPAVPDKNFENGFAEAVPGVASFFDAFDLGIIVFFQGFHLGCELQQSSESFFVILLPRGGVRRMDGVVGAIRVGVKVELDEGFMRMRVDVLILLVEPHIHVFGHGQQDGVAPGLLRHNVENEVQMDS